MQRKRNYVLVLLFILLNNINNKTNAQTIDIRTEAYWEVENFNLVQHPKANYIGKYEQEFDKQGYITCGFDTTLEHCPPNFEVHFLNSDGVSADFEEAVAYRYYNKGYLYETIEHENFFKLGQGPIDTGRLYLKDYYDFSGFAGMLDVDEFDYFYMSATYDSNLHINIENPMISEFTNDTELVFSNARISDNVGTGFYFNWQYTINSSDYHELTLKGEPYRVSASGNNTFTLKASDFPNLNIDDKLYLRLNTYDAFYKNYVSNVVVLTYKQGAPRITNISSEVEDCGENASVTVTFNRALRPGEKLNLAGVRDAARTFTFDGISSLDSDNKIKLIETRKFEGDYLPGFRPGETYKIQVTSATDSTVGFANSYDTDPFTIPAYTPIQVDNITKQEVSCFGGTNGSLSMSITGGSGVYQYSKDGGTYQNFSAPVSGVYQIPNLGAGTHSIRIQDSDGCSPDQPSQIIVPMITGVSVEAGGIISATITAPTELVADELALRTKKKVTGFGYADGAIEYEITGGTAPYTVECKRGSTIISADGGTGPPNYFYQNLPVGTYTLTVTDNKGCTLASPVSFTIENTPKIGLVETSSTDVSCHSGSVTGNTGDGFIKVTANGGNGGFTYELKKVGDIGFGTRMNTTGEFGSLSKGVYRATVKDSQNVYYGNEGLTDRIKEYVSINIGEPSLIAVTGTVSHVNCSGVAEGTISLNIPTGGTGEYSYSWSDGATTQNRTGLRGGNYTVTITDTTGCSIQESFTVEEPSTSLAARHTATEPTNIASANGTISVYVKGGLQSYTAKNYRLIWKSRDGTIVRTDTTTPTINNTTGEAIYTLSGLSNGERYSVEIIDADSNQSCSQTISNIDITAPDPINFSIPTPSVINCFGSSTGSLTATGVTGGTVGGVPGTYVYEWFKKNTSGVYEKLIGKTSETISNVTAGDYRLTISGGGQSKSVDQTLTENSNLVLTEGTVQDVSCHGQSTGVIPISFTGGTAPYDVYLGTSKIRNDIAAANNHEIKGLSSGTYNVKVVDALGCEKILTNINVAQPTSAVTISNPIPINPSFFGATNGNITVEVRGGMPNYSYTWVNEATPSISIPANKITKTNLTGGGIRLSLNGVAKGTYKLTVRDANNLSGTCEAVFSQQLISPAELTLGITEVTQVSCFGGTDGQIIANASGGDAPTTGYTYTYQKSATSNGTYSNYSTGRIAQTLSKGFYKVIVSDGIVSTTYSAPIEITEPGALAATAKAVSFPCYVEGSNQGEIQVNNIVGGTKPYTLRLKASGNIIGTPITLGDLATSHTFLNLIPDTYTVEITDSTGCSPLSKTELVISAPSFPLNIVTLENEDPLSHNGSNGTIKVRISGGTPKLNNTYDYTWKKNGIVLSNQGTGSVVSGGYELELTGLSSGTYNLEVKDKNAATGHSGCLISESYTLVNPTAINVSIFKNKEISCSFSNGFDSADGALRASAIGGVVGLGQDYTYTWEKEIATNTFAETGKTGSVASDLSSGKYRVIARDSNQITKASVTIELEKPAVLEVDLEKGDVFCYGGSDGFVKATVQGGTAPYYATWNSEAEVQLSSSFFEKRGLYESTNNLVVRDSRNCEVTHATIEITQPASALRIDQELVKDPLSHNANDGIIKVKVIGGSPKPGNLYNYTWTTTDGLLVNQGMVNQVSGDFEITLEDLPSGTYELEVKDANYELAGTKTGCIVSSSFTLINPPLLTVSISETNPISCHSANVYGNEFSDGELSANVAGGIPFTIGAQYKYQWQKKDPIFNAFIDLLGETNAVAEGLSAGDYRVVISDGNNIQKTAVFTLVDPVLLSASMVIKKVYCHGGNDGAITAAINGGTPPYYVIWNDNTEEKITGNTSSLSSLKKGIYTFRVRDSSIGGCEFENNNIEVTEPLEALSIVSKQVIDPKSNNASDGRIQVVVKGGTPNSGNTYNYTWTTTDGTLANQGEVKQVSDEFEITLKDIPSGTYVLQVTDANYSSASHRISCIASERYTLSNPLLLNAEIAETHFISCNSGGVDESSDGVLTVTVTGGIPFTGRAAYDYQWFKQNINTGLFEILRGQRAAIASGLNAGVYRVEATDFNGIKKTSDFTLTEPDLLAVSLETRNVFCYQGNDGFIKATISGGTAPYFVEWNGATKTELLGNTTEVLNLSKGDYSYRITDARDCVVLDDTIEITAPENPLEIVFEAEDIIDPKSNNASDGSIRIKITGGTSALDKSYQYRWQKNNVEFTGGKITRTVLSEGYELLLENIAWGQYRLIVEDQNFDSAATKTGCKVLADFVLSNPSSLNAEVTETHFISCNSGGVDESSDGALTVTVTGGIPFTGRSDYDYQWFKQNTSTGLFEILTGQRAAIASGLNAGEYRVEATDFNGIKKTSDFTLTEPDLLTVSLETRNVFCYQGNDGFIKATISGGTAPYFVEWNGATKTELLGNTTEILNLSKGDYSYRITDARDCVVLDDTIEITAPENPLDITYTAYGRVSVFGGSDGFIEASITGGTAFAIGNNYHFKWENSLGVDYTDRVEITASSPAELVLTLKGLPSGTYHLTVEDANYNAAVSKEGCTIISSEFILYEPITASISIEQEISCHHAETYENPTKDNEFSDGILKATVQGGAPFETGNPYKYIWKKKNKEGVWEVLDTQQEAEAMNLGAGEYALNIEDRLGSAIGTYNGAILLESKDEFESLTEPDLLEIEEITFTKVSCDVGNDATATVFFKGGTAPYTIQWNNPKGDTVARATELSPGEHMVTITDARGCEIVGKVIVPNFDNTKIIELNHLDITCEGYEDGRFTIEVVDGQGPYSFGWKHRGTGLETSGLLSGSYRSNITNENQNTPFTNVTDGYALNDLFTDGGSKLELTDLIPGSYEVTAVDVNRCRVTRNIIISAPSIPLGIEFTTGSKNPSAPNFTDGVIEARILGGTLSSSETYQFTWTDKDGNDLKDQTTTFYDNASASFVIQLNGLAKGVYSLSINDATYVAGINEKGCSVSGIYELTDPSALNLSLEETHFISCHSDNIYGDESSDGALIAHASGGVTKDDGGLLYDYIWKKKNETTGVFELLTSQTTAVASGLSAGIYSLNILDKNGVTMGVYVNNVLQESQDIIYELRQPDVLALEITQQNVYCYAGSDGFIEAKVLGGTAPFEVVWNTGKTETLSSIGSVTKINNLVKGDYDIEIVDARGCVVRQDFKMDEPQKALELKQLTLRDPSYHNATDGLIVVSVENGTNLLDGSYHYIWTTADGSLVNQGSTEVVAGVYTISLSGIPSGTYHLSIEDANFASASTRSGCTIGGSFTLENPSALNLSLEETHFISCHSDNIYGDESSDGALIAHASGGVTKDDGGLLYDYIWKKKNETTGVFELLTSQTTAVASGLSAGIYSLNILDKNGITMGVYVDNVLQESQDIIYELTQPDVLALEITQQNVYCYAGNDGSIEAKVLGGTAPFKVVWNTGKTEILSSIGSVTKINNLVKGDYDIEIVDARGCVVRQDFKMDEPQKALELKQLTLRDPSYHNATDGLIVVSVENGTNLLDGSYHYVWTTTDGSLVNQGSTEVVAGVYTISLSGIPSGTYHLNIEDANFASASTRSGCTIGGSFTLENPSALNLSLEETHFISCHSDNIYGDESSDGVLTAHASGGITKDDGGLLYDYIWKKKNETTGVFELLTSQTTAVASGLSAGIYSLNILDKNGITIGVYVDNVLQESQDIIYELRQPDVLALEITQQNVYCYAGSDGFIEAKILGGTAPFKVVWNTGKTEILSSIGSVTKINNLVKGDYDIEIVDARGCIVLQNFKMKAPNELEITYPEFERPSAYQAADGEIEAIVSGGTIRDAITYRYVWKNEKGELLNDQVTEERINATSVKLTLKNIPAGTYALTVEDAHYDSASTKEGCHIEKSIFEIYEPIQIHITETESILCNGANLFTDEASNGKLEATVVGGVPFKTGLAYQFIWKKKNSSGNWEVLSNQTKAIASNLDTGIYAVNVLDSRGTTLGVYDGDYLEETTDVEFELQEPALLAVTLSKTPVDCDSGNNGTAKATIQGGTAPYKIAWSTGATTLEINQLIPGKYFISITDKNGCHAEGTVTIEAPKDLYLEVVSINSPTCNKGKDGLIEVKGIGGIAPYKYEWNNGILGSKLSGVPSGIYTVTITDSNVKNNSCSYQETFELINPVELPVNLGSDRTLCRNQTAELDLTSIDSSATYRWSGPNGFTSNKAKIKVSEAGVYTGTVINEFGCENSDDIEIFVEDIEIGAEFLLTSTAYTDKEIQLVNVSRPKPDLIEWILPESVEMRYQDDDYVTLVFKKEGTVSVGMRAYKGDCYIDYQKNIFVEKGLVTAAEIEDEGAFIQSLEVFPNPSHGIFQTRVRLRKESIVVFRVINMQNGNTVGEYTSSSKEAHLQNFNLSVSPGIYLLIIDTPYGNALRKIIID